MYNDNLRWLCIESEIGLSLTDNYIVLGRRKTDFNATFPLLSYTLLGITLH